jgi:dipeptidyl aminopeptidase/acylaminoacyl peptidase
VTERREWKKFAGWAGLAGGAAVALLLAVVPPAAATDKVSLTAESMWGFKRVGGPALSPDGKLAVIPVSQFDLKTDKRSGDLWLLPTAGGPLQQLTADPAVESDPLFSPDGKNLAFVARRGDDKVPQLYILPMTGGEARRITDVPTGVARPLWLPDGSGLTFITRIWTDLDGWEAQGGRLKEREESKMTARVWDKAPISFWDHWLDEREAHIYIAPLAGGAPVAVTRGRGRPVFLRDPGPMPYDIAPDGKQVAYSVNTDTSGVRQNTDVFTTDLATGATRNQTEANPNNDSEPQYSPDGRWLNFLQRRLYGFYGENAKPMLVDRRSGETQGIAESWDRSAEGLRWLPDSSGLYGAIDDSATRRIYRLDVRGDTPKPLTGRSDFSDLAVAGKSLVALRQSLSQPPVLTRIEPKSGAATVLADLNADVLGRTALGAVESVTFKGAANADIQMWVVKPPNFDPAKKYPLFLLIHGGPHNAITDTWTWRWNAQVFANWGYVVAWHNFHGSSGFGQAFTDSINPNWADRPYEDTIKAAQYLAGQPWIDAGRMVAGGGSYGGYLASILLGRDHPFKALIAHAAVYNMYTQDASDGGAGVDRFAEYWEKPAEFQATSPHMAAGNFKTPTLVIHGQLDYRVPVNHGIELFNTLQKRGVPSRLIYYPNENHWVLKPQNSVFWYQQVRAWVEQYAPPNGR